tara:strand:+ start:587 stop:715 length:129 start_codon:yes stop_codon:yes gene_type:complete
MSDYYNNDDLADQLDNVLKILAVMGDKLDKLQLQLDDMEANK